MNSETVSQQFNDWLSVRWIRGRGGYRLNPNQVSAVVEMIYQGQWCRRIEKVTGFHRDTVGRLKVRLFAFLEEFPELPKPTCVCGKHLWHRRGCPALLAELKVSQAKGHATQSRIARENQATIFFQSVNAVNKIIQNEPSKSGQ